MMNAATRLLLVLCLALPAVPAAANSADTTWLIDTIRLQLKTRAAWQVIEKCQSPESACLRLREDPDPLDIFSTAPYPPRLKVRHIPSPEAPWFLSLSDAPDEWSISAENSYGATTLVRRVKSLEVLSLISFWEKNGAQLFLGVNARGIVGMHLGPSPKPRRTNLWIGDVGSQPQRSSVVPASVFAH